MMGGDSPYPLCGVRPPTLLLAGKFQMELTGQRILLREFSQSDVSALAAIHSDPRVLRYYAPEVGTLEHSRMLVEMFMQWANENPRHNFQLAIVDKETGTLLGSGGVRRRTSSPGNAEFGIGIDSNWWGKGVAHEAASILLGFGFSELGLSEITGIAVAENESVSKFARRLGFTQRTARPGEAWMKERDWSALDWVITRETWNQLAG
jgi:RimJ/RimL family protein N-acetyltransferase